MKVDPFFFLRRRWMPENRIRVFDGRRRVSSPEPSLLTLWAVGIVWMVLVAAIVGGMMRATEAVERVYFPEAAAMLEGGR